jgi:hypothetical protein
MLFWAALGISSLLIGSLAAGAGTDQSVLYLATCSLLFGLRVFWTHGGHRITATGVYCFAFACFVGFPGIYYALEPGSAFIAQPYRIEALAICYFVQVVTWYIFWARQRLPERRPNQNSVPTVSAWSARAGAALLGLAVALRLAHLDGNPLVANIGYVGVLLIGIWALDLGNRVRVARLLITAAAFIVYMEYLFSGYGRIILTTLAFSILTCLSYRLNTAFIKAAAIAFTAPAVLFLMKFRVNVVAELHSDANSHETGLESMLSPLPSFATLLQLHHDGTLPSSYGKTFLVALIFFIPRSIWVDKPIGFGAELVAFISPDLVGTGHSSAALLFGEFLYNFGYAGFILMIPALGLALRHADEALARRASTALDTRFAVVQYASYLVVCCGVVDLIWMGGFNYTARAGSRLLVLAAVFLVFAWKDTVHPRALHSRLTQKVAAHPTRRDARGL